MPSKPAIPGSIPGGRTILAGRGMLSYVDTQSVVNQKLLGVGFLFEEIFTRPAYVQAHSATRLVATNNQIVRWVAEIAPFVKQSEKSIVEQIKSTDMTHMRVERIPTLPISMSNDPSLLI